MKQVNKGKQLLSKAKWIWPQTNFYDLYNSYAHFRKDFTLDRVPEEAVLYITADQGYRLWVNGSYVTRGPARGYQAHWPYDEADIARFLHAGANFISVEVYNPGVSTFSYVSQTRAGLLCAADLGSLEIRSDASWISRLDTAHKKDTAKYSLQLNFQEHVDTSKDDRSWITSPDIPQGWVRPEETPFGSMPWHDLEERGIPLLRETGRTPVKIVAVGEGKAGEDYMSWRNIVSGFHYEMKKAVWKKEDADISGSGTVTLPAAGKDGLRTVVLDMGELVVGPSIVYVEGGKPGQILDIFYHEVLEENGSPVILHPDHNHCRISMGNRLILSGEHVSYDFYQLLGFRYITLVTRENEKPLTIRVVVSDTGYPYNLEGSFECSDNTLNDIWKVCRRTEQVCSLDSYVDTPWREQAQWWGDARVQFWNTIAIDGDTRLFKRGIRSIAGQKVPNGLTYGHAPTMAHNCILPDFSMVWILSIYDYYLQTKDLSLFEEQLPRIEEVLSYFEKEAPRYKGLLGYDQRYWLFLDWSTLNKQGAPALYNMWYLLTLRTLAEMHRLAGHDLKAGKLEKAAADFQTAVEENLFDFEQGLFCDGISAEGIPLEKYSVHSQTMAVMLDLKPEYHARMFEKRILPFLRGDKIEAALPSTYWTSYVLTTAREKGYNKEALDFIRRMWTPVIPFGTCPETFDIIMGDSSYSHAWSAHPVFHLMNLLGGVARETAGWDSIVFQPHFAEELDWVRIKHPTPHGLVESRWERKDGRIKIMLELPNGMKAKVRIPGFEAEIEGRFEYTL